MKHPFHVGRIQRMILVLAASSLPIAGFRCYKAAVRLAERGLIKWGEPNTRGEQSITITDAGLLALNRK